MDFVLFILLNAVLLLRPEELFPAIAGLRLYLIVIVTTTAASLPKLAAKCNLLALAERPVAVCAVGMLVMAFLSLIPTGRLADALDFCGEFAKVLLYFFLLLAVVDTPARHRAFAGWIVLFVSGLTLASLAHVNDVWHFPAIEPVMQRFTDQETGEERFIPRLVSSGFFNDPNDLCLILSVGVICCFYRATECQIAVGKLLWLLPVVLFLYAMKLTYSRGGVLGLAGGLAAYLYGRYGWRRGVPAAAIVVAMTILGFGGRQSEIGGGTARDRIMLWAEGFTDMFRRPLYIPMGFGVGYYVEEHYLVAHNSFVNAYIETGLIGGGLYLGMFVYAARISHWTGTRPGASDWARRTRPFALAMIGAYAVGTYSVSRNYVIPTYMVIGFVMTLWEIERPADTPDRFRVGSTWLRHMTLWAVGGFVFLKFFTQFAGQAGL